MNSILLLYLMLIFMFLPTNAPMFLALMLTFQSFTLYLMFSYLFSSWMGMSILLIFSGGMMIIFLYMTSITTNYKYLLKFKYIFILAPLSSAPLPSNPMTMNSYSFSMNHLYAYYNWPYFILLLIYILFTLFFVVMLAERFYGSLKKSY